MDSLWRKWCALDLFTILIHSKDSLVFLKIRGSLTERLNGQSTLQEQCSHAKFTYIRPKFHNLMLTSTKTTNQRSPRRDTLPWSTSSKRSNPTKSSRFSCHPTA